MGTEAKASDPAIASSSGSPSGAGRGVGKGVSFTESGRSDSAGSGAGMSAYQRMKLMSSGAGRRAATTTAANAGQSAYSRGAGGSKAKTLNDLISQSVGNKVIEDDFDEIDDDM